MLLACLAVVVLSSAIMADSIRMEPIVLRRRPEDDRVHALCCLCHKPRGVCVRCRWLNCQRHFHVRCAKDGEYLSGTG